MVAAALLEARNAGASQAEADASLQRGLTVTVRLGEVDTIEYHRDRGLAVTVYIGKSKGSASTADLRHSAVSETVRKALAIAKHTAEDDCAGLADAQELAQEIPDLLLHHPWDISPEQAVELARSSAAAGISRDPRLQNSGDHGDDPCQRARARQQPRLPGRLPQHQSFAELRPHRAGTRGYAA